MMKHLNLLALLFLVVMISACGAKEEETEDVNEYDEFIDETVDTSSLPYTVDESEEISNPADSSSEETMILPEENMEVQIDPPVEEEEEEEIKKEEPVEKEVKTPHQKRFYVVVGSFKEYNNAERLKQQFKDEGYFPMILPKVSEYNRVAISSFVEEANARKAVKMLREKYNDLTFWLYKW